MTWQIGVGLERDRHFDAASSALTERGEAGLCNVAAFLEGRMDAHQDLGTLSAAHPWLKRLDLSDGTQYPTRGLLDVGAWCGPDRDGPLEPPADMEVVLQAVLVAKPGLWVQLCCALEVAEEVAEQVQDLAAEVEDELVEIGDPEPRRLEVELEVKAGVEGGG
ncbi:hypothetical protein HYH03_013819 [Edaphochlamys debaryana]|uniref:Uncharacterized protein n=1 Tax=Edaphochlamys debaryana TaxID=47281 RepID=A0A836BSR9_9CHLO|nr:hypothetical protein HYH03_013819 [Edaphochlamys debaryana]|eukprot:KAG2487540.1 hypothetical protein HYH03_013819 [Edaphochlamys debaryana]